MPVDASPYASAKGATPYNPLTTMQSVEELRALRLRNQLLPIEMQREELGLQSDQNTIAAKTAVGRAVQGAIGPNGEYSPTNALTAIKADPNAAWGATDAVTNAQDVTGKQINNAQGNVQLGAARQNYYGSQLGAVLSNYPPGADIPFAEIAKIGSRAVRANGQAGSIDDPAGAAAWQLSIPKDPAARRQWAEQQFLASQPQTVAGTYEITDPQTGQKVTLSHSQMLGRLYGTLKQPGATSAPGAAQGTDAAAPAASPAPAVGVASGPVPGRVASTEALASQGAGRAGKLSDAASRVPDQIAGLNNMLGDLQGFESSPIASKVARLKSLASAVGIPWDQDGMASEQGFSKIATQLALQQTAALGASDARQAAVMNATPNPELGTKSNVQIIHKLVGNAEAVAVKNGEWQNWLASGHGPETFNSFETAFNKAFDPRVFQFQHMGPEERTALVKAMTPKDRDTFRQKLDAAERFGWTGQGQDQAAGAAP